MHRAGDFDDDRFADEDDDDRIDDTSDEPVDDALLDGDDASLGKGQFALGTLFFAITLARAYFAVERYSGGRFALGTVLVLAIGMPLLYILAWASRLLLDAGVWGTLLWIVGMASLVALGFFAIYSLFT